MSDLRASFEIRMQEVLDQMLIMGSKTVHAVDLAVQSLLKSDISLADKVICNDDEIDQFYKNIEEKVIVIIARQLPVAIDLRVLISILIVTLHLERIGDLAVNIASRAKCFIEAHGNYKREDIFQIIEEMHVKSLNLLEQALRAFAGRDNQIGRKLHIQDDTIDDLNKALIRKTSQYKDSDDFELLLDLIMISRWLERVADHTVDIGDLTRFVVSGKII